MRGAFASGERCAEAHPTWIAVVAGSLIGNNWGMQENELQDDSDQKEGALAPVEEESDVEHFRFKLSKTLTRRVDQYLVDRVPHLSRAGVQRLIEEGLVKVNGKIVKASYRPKEGDVVEMVAPPEPVSEIVPENIPLEILYEDEHFLALNKQ